MIEVGKTYIGCHGHYATVTTIAGDKVFYRDQYGICFDQATDLFTTIYIKRGQGVV